LPPLSRIRLFKQYLLGVRPIYQLEAESIFPPISDLRPIPDVKSKWGLILYILDRKREWGILGGWENHRYNQGPQFYIDLWAHLEIIDFIESEEYYTLERAAKRLQYEYRSKLSANRHLYNYFCGGYKDFSGYSRGPFSKEFHRKQLAKVAKKQEESKVYTSLSQRNNYTLK